MKIICLWKLHPFIIKSSYVNSTYNRKKHVHWNMHFHYIGHTQGNWNSIPDLQLNLLYVKFSPFFSFASKNMCIIYRNKLSFIFLFNDTLPNIIHCYYVRSIFSSNSKRIISQSNYILRMYIVTRRRGTSVY